MKMVPASEAKNKFGQTIEAALVEPVAITKKDRPVVVMISASEYQRLLEIEDERSVNRAIEDEKEGYITPEEAEKLINLIRKQTL